MSLLSSRGCPYRCIFCFDAHSRALKFRKPEALVEEMMELKKRYGFKKFMFQDDTFVVSAQRIKRFADLLEGKGIEFVCNGRCNIMTEDIVRDLKRAGCVLLYFGVESGVQRVLDVMNKQITIKQIVDSLELAKKYKIKTAIFILMSIPTETIDEMRQTIEFSKKLHKKYKCTVDLSILYAYPNTPVYKMAGYDIKDWSVRRHNWKYPSVPIYIDKQYDYEKIMSLYKKFILELNIAQTRKKNLPVAAVKYIIRKSRGRI
jgi:radical SAM superfamily enzyme YgiQ (UPF0313 family)